MLCKYILDMENKLMGFSSIEVRSLAYQLAVRFNLQHHFNNETGNYDNNFILIFFI